MMATELLDGVWLHTSKRAATTTTVIALGDHECMVVDPAMEPPDLVEVAELVREVGRTVTVGWSTHPHWDHVLWSSRLGTEVVRFATRRNAELCRVERRELEAYLEDECPGHETELCGLLTPLEDGERRWPTSCRVIAHEAHAPGHGALWVPDKGLLVAGDMVSDVEIPTLDLGSHAPGGRLRRGTRPLRGDRERGRQLCPRARRTGRQDRAAATNFRRQKVPRRSRLRTTCP